MKRRVITRAILGGVLIIAGFLKHVSPESLSNVDAFAGQLEILLGLSLILGIYECATYGVAILTFSALATVSAIKIVEGATSCGCFGSVAMPPHFSLAINFLAIGLLLITFPDPQFSKSSGGANHVVA